MQVWGLPHAVMAGGRAEQGWRSRAEGRSSDRRLCLSALSHPPGTCLS